MFEQKMREISELAFRITEETDSAAVFHYGGHAECFSVHVTSKSDADRKLYDSGLKFKGITPDSELNDVIDNLHLFVKVKNYA